jgi:predicted nuclease with TOPRIM domain
MSKIDKRQKEYDRLLKQFEELNRKAKHTKQRLAELRREMTVNPILVDERPDENNMK